MEKRTGHLQEQKAHWDIFFDLHDVLAYVSAVGKNYESYLAKVLAPAGVTRGEAINIHGEAFKRWIGEFRRLTDGLEGDDSSPESFMDRMREIDRKWEDFVLGSVSLENREVIAPQLNTSKLEYEALAEGPYPVLYPEVKGVLERLKEIDSLSLYIASSASSHHVRGVVALHGLAGYFKKLIGYDTVEAPKKSPSGQYFKKMLTITGADPFCSIFVGDTIEEATLATKSGMKFVMVQRNQQSLENRVKTIKFDVVRNLTEFLAVISDYIE
ncbi:MAG: HAD family hydrolase [Candidatus Odinarchaeota archaeon]